MKESIKQIEVGITEEELYELLEGEDFNWTFDGVDVHIYKDTYDEEMSDKDIEERGL